MKPIRTRGALLGALALGGALAASSAFAAYKMTFGWNPKPHFPAPLVEPGPKPGLWLFKTKTQPELEIRRGNWELRVNWDRTDLAEWPYPRILQAMLRFGCEIVDVNRAKALIDQLYATRSLVPPRMAPDGSTAILHRLSVFDSGCVIWMEARGSTKMHLLKVVVSPPPRPKPKTN